MSSKKKIILATTSCVMVMLAVAIAVVAILAARTVTINSSININFTATDVEGSVKVVYYVGNETDGWGTEQSLLSETDLTADSISGGSIDEDDLEEKEQIKIVFTFKNTETVSADDYNAVFTLPTINNFNLLLDNNSDGTPEKNGNPALFGSDGWNIVTVAPGATKVVTMIFSVADNTSDASISGNLSCAISQAS